MIERVERALAVTPSVTPERVMRLTAESVRKMNPAESRREVPDSNCPGLYLVIQPSGSKSWSVRYRHAGQPRKLTLGAYDPDTRGLIEARELAREALKRVDKGFDPATEKVQAREHAARQADFAKLEAERASRGEVLKPTDYFETVWTAFEADHMETLRPVTQTSWKGVYRRELKPRWAKREIGSLTAADVTGLLHAMRKTPHAADVARVVCRVFLGWCADKHKLFPISPAEGVAKVKRPKEIEEKEDTRTLSDAEVRWLWLACGKVKPQFGNAVRLLLLTGARRSEVAKMTDGELNEAKKLWTLPASRTKSGRAHSVHLSAEVLAVLKATPRVKNKSGYVFCTNGETAISGYSKFKIELDDEMAVVASQELREPVKIEPWHLHTLRKTFATGCARLGISQTVTARCLNHRTGGKQSDLDRIYNRHDYAPEQVAAFNAWSRHVAGIVANKPRNVVPLRRA